VTDAREIGSEPRVSERGEGGFSMIEVIVAMLILTIGVLGLAGTTAYIVRQVTLGDLMTERSAAFQTIIDRLQSLPYDSVTSGNTTVGVFAISWTSANDGPQNKIVQMITVGPGLGGALVPTNDPVAVDTFTFRVLRR
jgi:prepilin-type N-terminal cleavage/methylation domain-containing protein